MQTLKKNKMNEVWNLTKQEKWTKNKINMKFKHTGSHIS